MPWEVRIARRIHVFDGHVALILWYLTVLQFANFAATRTVDILPTEVAMAIFLPPECPGKLESDGESMCLMAMSP
jgi:hypothetical protein